MRYVFQTDEHSFVRWIVWTAGVIPTFASIDKFEKAMIVDEDYLNFVIKETGKTRRELIQKYKPDTKIVRVNVEIASLEN